VKTVVKNLIHLKSKSKSQQIARFYWEDNAMDFMDIWQAFIHSWCSCHF